MLFFQLSVFTLSSLRVCNNDNNPFLHSMTVTHHCFSVTRMEINSPFHYFTPFNVAQIHNWTFTKLVVVLLLIYYVLLFVWINNPSLTLNLCQRVLLLIEVLHAHQRPNPSVWKKTAQFYKLNLFDILLRYLSEIIGLKKLIQKKNREWYPCHWSSTPGWPNFGLLNFGCLPRTLYPMPTGRSIKYSTRSARLAVLTAEIDIFLITSQPISKMILKTSLLVYTQRCFKKTMYVYIADFKKKL